MLKHRIISKFLPCLLLTSIVMMYETTPSISSPRLDRTRFYLPGDGIRNNNQRIGPFCCTGETAIVYTNRGYPAGYVYFFGWVGQSYNVGDTSIAPDIQILVSGLANLSKPTSQQLQNVISFRASEMRPGVSRSARAGSLYYTVTIERAKIRDGNFFDMGSVAIRVDVGT
jgi:hypothetical protein